MLFLRNRNPSYPESPRNSGNFHHVVGELPSTAAEDVVDIITSFHHNYLARPYYKLKTTFLERATASKRTRIQQLLSAEELGDQRPSQRLRRMTQLLSTSVTTMDTEALHEVFIQPVTAVPGPNGACYTHNHEFDITGCASRSSFGDGKVFA
ncbi:hypothetical protein MRX96_023747 [Rhipicephalus microplus]